MCYLPLRKVKTCKKILIKKYMHLGSYDPFEITNVQVKPVMNMLLKQIVYITALNMVIGIQEL